VTAPPELGKVSNTFGLEMLDDGARNWIDTRPLPCATSVNSDGHRQRLPSRRLVDTFTRARRVQGSGGNWMLISTTRLPAALAVPVP